MLHSSGGRLPGLPYQRRKAREEPALRCDSKVAVNNNREGVAPEAAVDVLLGNPTIGRTEQSMT
jgi:hypothetical protein